MTEPTVKLDERLNDPNTGHGKLYALYLGRALLRRLCLFARHFYLPNGPLALASLGRKITKAFVACEHEVCERLAEIEKAKQNGEQ